MNKSPCSTRAAEWHRYIGKVCCLLLVSLLYWAAPRHHEGPGNCSSSYYAQANLDAKLNLKLMVGERKDTKGQSCFVAEQIAPRSVAGCRLSQSAEEVSRMTGEPESFHASRAFGAQSMTIISACTTALYDALNFISVPHKQW